MLTADLALNADAAYSALTTTYANDIVVLENDFGEAWYKLMTRDVNYKQCIGSMTPTPRDWQMPLPDPPTTTPSFIAARSAIQKMIDDEEVTTAELAQLAFQCAGTYRETDHTGGCNGARIRFPPEKDWDDNVPLQGVITKLEGIDAGDVSFADLIVLGGYTAIEHDGGNEMTFCGNRVDANGDFAKFAGENLPRTYDKSDVAKVKDDCVIRGFATMEECVAVSFGHPTDTLKLGEIFTFISEGEVDAAAGSSKVVNGVTSIQMLTGTQLALHQDAELKAISDKFASNEAAFKTAFAAGWVHLMNAGRYTGPNSNYCDGKNDKTVDETEPTDSGATLWGTAAWYAASTLATTVSILM